MDFNATPYVRALEAQLKGLEPLLEPMLESSLHDQTANLSELDKCKYYNSYAYAIISLLFAHLKASGVKTDNHPIMRELDRVKNYMENASRAGSEKPEDLRRRKVDKEAADRFIRHAVGARATGHTPAISSVNFQGKKTRFDDDGNPIVVQEKRPSDSSTGGRDTRKRKKSSRKDTSEKK